MADDITVTDNRGGSFGWSLTASMTSFSGSGGNNMAASTFQASPTCTPATAATAWDYNAAGQTAIPGFDPSLVAPGQSAGPASQSFSGAVTLCTKDTTINEGTQSTGGVYTVSSPLTLTVPSFQAADRYTAVMTITLA